MENNYNGTIHLTGNDELDFELLEIERSAIYIDIFSIILGLTATRQAEELILQRAMEPQQNNQQNQNKRRTQQQKNKSSKQNQNNVQHPTPSEISAIASCLGVYTELIYLKVSFIRLNELYNNIQRGNTSFSIGPNINITVGLLYSLIGRLLKTIGAIQRVNEEAQITIF